jgi:hypothetical protein
LKSIVSCLLLAAATRGFAQEPTITPAPSSGASLAAISLSRTNPRYFTDGTRSIYMTGQHIPTIFNDWTGAPTIDFTAFIDNMAAKGHNFLRLWVLDNPKPQHLDHITGAVTPLPFKRTGPGRAADSGLKFDLSQLDQSFFDRLRARVKEAGNKGIYVSVMFSCGIFVNDPENWTYSMYRNPANNINADTAGMSNTDQWTLNNPAWCHFMNAYVDKVVDTLNDLDNVLYEVSNEAAIASSSWQERVIDRVHAREATAGRKVHFVGKTSYDGNSNDATINANLLASHADWISLAGRTAPPTTPNYRTDVPDASGPQVSLLDTDHIYGFGTPALESEMVQWVWRSLTRGHNPIYITSQTGYPASVVKGKTVFNHSRLVEAALGYSRTMADRCDLIHMPPDDSKSSTGYALVNPNKEYLIYQPRTTSFTVTLPAQRFSLEWMNPATGTLTASTTYSASSGANTFTLPTGFASGVLRLYTPEAAGLTPTATAVASASGR